MKKSRYTEQQIIGFLKEVEAGLPIADLCRREGFGVGTFYSWRAKFGGMVDFPEFSRHSIMSKLNWRVTVISIR